MAQEPENRYSSPPRKLIRFFEKSRDQWKVKCQRAKATVKRLENRVRFLEKSKAQWKSKAHALEKENAQLKAQAPSGDMQREASSRLKKNPLSLPSSPSPPAFGYVPDTTPTVWD